MELHAITLQLFICHSPIGSYDPHGVVWSVRPFLDRISTPRKLWKKCTIDMWTSIERPVRIFKNEYLDIVCLLIWKAASEKRRPRLLVSLSPLEASLLLQAKCSQLSFFPLHRQCAWRDLQVHAFKHNFGNLCDLTTESLERDQKLRWQALANLCVAGPGDQLINRRSKCQPTGGSMQVSLIPRITESFPLCKLWMICIIYTWKWWCGMHDDHDDFSSLVIGCDELMIHHPCACCHDLEVNGPRNALKILLVHRMWWKTCKLMSRVECDECWTWWVMND